MYYSHLQFSRAQKRIRPPRCLAHVHQHHIFPTWYEALINSKSSKSLHHLRREQRFHTGSSYYTFSQLPFIANGPSVGDTSKEASYATGILARLVGYNAHGLLITSCPYPASDHSLRAQHTAPTHWEASWQVKCLRQPPPRSTRYTALHATGKLPFTEHKLLACARPTTSRYWSSPTAFPPLQ